MATLKFQNIDKVYDNNVQAVFDFNLDIKDKEFIVFVGPSGCGKSTTLRMVAGLEAITRGKLYINDVLMNDIEPMNRGIAMVFQNYALYPTMTVYNNMAFSLKMRKFPIDVLDKDGNNIIVIDKELIKKKELLIKQAKYEIKELLFEEKARVYGLKKEAKNENKEVDASLLEKPQALLDKISEVEDRINTLNQEITDLKANPSAKKVKMVHMKKDEIKTRVEEAAKILGLTDYLQRKPAALSGGQRQRVALGRAIVRKPDVFLMDEPLSNLDAKLRVQTRGEITRIHNSVGATTIYVTHDQTEAMTMADRIVVMRAGYIQQIATPKEVYENPSNIFVATFIGSPSMNILDAIFNGTSVKIGEEFTHRNEKGFKEKHDEFYKNQKEIATKLIEKLEIEVHELALFGERKNKKAINQRQEIINKNKENIVFFDKALENREHEVKIGIRPEHIFVEGDYNNTNPSKPISVIPTAVELLGNEYIVYTSITNQPLIIKIPSAHTVEVGKEIKVCFNLDKVHIFDPASTLKL